MACPPSPPLLPLLPFLSLALTVPNTQGPCILCAHVSKGETCRVGPSKQAAQEALANRGYGSSGQRLGYVVQ